MILITKDEAEQVRKLYPDAEIVRTCKQKSKRHKYYLPECRPYLRIIQGTNIKAAQLLFNEKNGQRLFTYN